MKINTGKVKQYAYILAVYFACLNGGEGVGGIERLKAYEHQAGTFSLR